MLAEVKNRLNIKEMVLKEPIKRDDFVFNPSKDLSPNLQVGLEIAMEEDVKKFDSRYFGKNHILAQRTLYYHLIFPEKLKSQISNIRWALMKGTLFDPAMREHVTDTLFIMKTADSDSLKKSVIISDGVWKGIIQRFEDQVKKPSKLEGMYEAIRAARAIKVISGSERLHLTDETRDKMYQSIVKFGPEMSLRDHAAKLSDFRILDEERFQKYKVEHLDEYWNMWKNIKKRLEDAEMNNPNRNLTDLIGTLSILSADSLKVIDNGVKLINNDVVKEQAKITIPAMRRF
jgi:hypothetical protein